jgi:hypothetical protein
VHIYAVHAFPSSPADSASEYQPVGRSAEDDIDHEALPNGKLNGHAKLNGSMNGNGHAGLNERQMRHVRGAEEFELDVMSSDEEDEGRRGDGPVRV